jgi:hypothetical protein
MRSGITFLAAACIALSALCGCGGYRFGPTNSLAAGAKSVQITPFLNHSTEPGLADEVTSAVRKSVQRDGTYRLATRGESDLVMTGVINSYQRREMSLSRDELRTVRDYQVVLTAQVVIRERATGKILVDRAVNGDAVLRVGADLGASERQLVPQLADDLAKRIIGLLVDGGW